MTAARRISLDATVGDGLTYGAVIGHAGPDQADIEAEGAEEGPTPDDGLQLVGAALRARRATEARERAEVVLERARLEEERATFELVRVGAEVAVAARSLDLATLSERQLAVVRARLAILRDDGEMPTHHAVARRLGITAGAARNHWQRIEAKLAGGGSGREVSTSAA